MNTSYFLARFLGPLLLVIGLSVAVNRKAYTAMANEFLASPSLVYLAGVFALTGGLAIVLNHNVWAADWRIIITLLGWLSTLSGVVRLLLPEVVQRFGRTMVKKEQPILWAGIGWIVLGAILCFAGYARSF